jgi:methionyl-tRNA formyltransferase
MSSTTMESSGLKKSSGLKVVFFGTPEFAAHILEYLIANGENIVAAVTIPDKPQGRGLKLRPSAVKLVALSHNIPVLEPTKLRDSDFIEALAKLDADCFCVVAYRILPRDVYTLPKIGAFNIHASILPKYRGAAPINWAIIRGETESGITTFLLEDKVDTGNVLLKESVPIRPNETAGELHDALMHLGAKLGHETLLGLSLGNLAPKKQLDTAATTAPKIFPADCIIDFSKPAIEVHNFIRGLSPHPGAITTLHNGAKVKLLRSLVTLDIDRTLAVGEYYVTPEGKRLLVGTGNGIVEILALQREGKSAMKVAEFLRGGRALFD